MIRLIDQLEAISLQRFVSASIGQNGTFLAESAKLQLQHLWKLELRLLSVVASYQTLLREQDLGDGRSTEACGVRYDMLGHNSLCMLDRMSEWRAYSLAKHRPEVECLASLGSWKAREWLGAAGDGVDLAPDQVFADRFFFGDLHMAVALRDAYG